CRCRGATPRRSGRRWASDAPGSPELDAGRLEAAPVLAHGAVDRVGGDEVAPHLGGGLALGEHRIRLVASEVGVLDDARAEADVPALVAQDQLDALAQP